MTKPLPPRDKKEIQKLTRKGIVKTKDPVVFDRDGKVWIYFMENGERDLLRATRCSMLLIAGNSILLILEVVAPCKYSELCLLELSNACCL